MVISGAHMYPREGFYVARRRTCIQEESKWRTCFQEEDFMELSGMDVHVSRG
jgi:hypothetical protein